MSIDLAKRIIIIGAGAAGLTAAETLKRKGYTNITILERSDRAGGKCFSLEHESRFYELGACVLSSANKTVLALAKQYNVPTAQVQFDASMLLDSTTGEPIEEKSLLQKAVALRKELWRYQKLLRKYKHVTQPGLSDVPAELCVPFSKWAKQQGIEKFADELAPFFTGYGYGFFDEISAAYVLKYYSLDILKGFVTHKMYKLPKGIQHLWTEIAKHNDVAYNTTITHITRGEHIAITTNTQTLECDVLIVTSPLDEFAKFADARTEEKELFGKIQHYDYRTYAVFLRDFPKKSGYLLGNYTESRIGHPVFWYQRFSDSDLYTFYSFGDWKMSDEQLLKNITTVVEQLGGSVDRVHTIEHWKFFPHVTPQDMHDGYFDRFEKLQGNNNTYYAGELPNFSTVGLTAEYAEALVERFF